MLNYIAYIIAALAIIIGWMVFKGKKPPTLIGRKSNKTIEAWSKSEHDWQLMQKRGIYYCNVCKKIIGGYFSSSAYECKICGAIKHYLCPQKAIPCKQKAIPAGQKFNSHQWIDGNLPVNSICSVCKMTCGSIYGLDGSTCVWCQKAVHEDCKKQMDEICDFGRLKKYIILPSEVKIIKNQGKISKFLKKTQNAREKDIVTSSNQNQQQPVGLRSAVDIKVSLTQEDKCPIIAVVNKRSGGQMGDDILQSFYRYLNPIQVIDLIDEGLDKLKLFKNLKKLKLVVGGGDGTVGSVMTYVTQNFRKDLGTCKISVSVLPLGTGNDMGRCLGWGGGTTNSDVMTYLRQVGSSSEEILLDQWNVTIDGVKQENHKMYNYLGIGLDAKVALDFHNLRTKYPYLFKSRVGNKFFYTQMGTNQLIAGKKVSLKNIDLYCDDKLIKFGDLECIVIQNINNWGGGVANLWNNAAEQGNSTSESFLSDNSVQNSDTPQKKGYSQEKFKKQSYCDGNIEVLGFTSILHMGQVQIGLAQATRVCQGQKLEIKQKGNTPLHVQIDGEPFEDKGPSSIKIGLGNKVNVLVKRQHGKSLVETKVFKVLEAAEDQNKINTSQKDYILDQLFKALNE